MNDTKLVGKTEDHNQTGLLMPDQFAKDLAEEQESSNIGSFPYGILTQDTKPYASTNETLIGFIHELLNHLGIDRGFDIASERSYHSELVNFFIGHPDSAPVAARWNHDVDAPLYGPGSKLGYNDTTLSLLVLGFQLRVGSWLEYCSKEFPDAQKDPKFQDCKRILQSFEEQNAADVTQPVLDQLKIINK